MAEMTSNTRPIWDQHEEPLMIFIRLVISSTFACVGFCLLDYQWPHNFGGAPYVFLLMIPIGYAIFATYLQTVVSD